MKSESSFKNDTVVCDLKRTAIVVRWQHVCIEMTDLFNQSFEPTEALTPRNQVSVAPYERRLGDQGDKALEEDRIRTTPSN